LLSLSGQEGEEVHIGSGIGFALACFDVESWENTDLEMPHPLTLFHWQFCKKKNSQEPSSYR
jgi:hypothetical protein